MANDNFKPAVNDSGAQGLTPTEVNHVPAVPSVDFGAPSQAGEPSDGFGFEAPKVDTTVYPTTDIDTVPGTGAEFRDEGGILPFSFGGAGDDIWDSANTQLDLVGPFSADSNVAPMLYVRGTNIAVPMGLSGLPIQSVLDAGDSTGYNIDDDKFTAYVFDKSSALIENPGNPILAAARQAVSRIRERINSMFNRSTPFSDNSEVGMFLMLTAYHVDLGSVQLPFVTLASLLEYRKYLLKCGIRLDASWNYLARPEIYSALGEVFQTICDLPVYDLNYLKKINKLGRIYAATQKQSFPGTAIMQDLVIANPLASTSINSTKHELRVVDNNNKETIINDYAWLSTRLPCSMAEWMAVLSDGVNALATIHDLSELAAQIRTRHAKTITMLSQMFGRSALDSHYLQEFLPVAVDSNGRLTVAEGEIGYSYAFHERMEYAPVYFQVEVGSTSTNEIFNPISKLLGACDANMGSTAKIRRPVDRYHWDKAFRTSELYEIGLFKTWPTVNNNGFVFHKAQNPTVTFSVGNTAYGRFVDVADGWIYDAYNYIGYYAAFAGYFSLGFSGGEIVMLVPRALTTASPTNYACVPFHGNSSNLQTAFGGYAEYDAANGQINIYRAGDNDICGATRTYLPAQLWTSAIAEALDFHVLIVGLSNPTNLRQLPMAVYRGYNNGAWYEFNASIMNTAVSATYRDLIQDVRVVSRR